MGTELICGGFTPAFEMDIGDGYKMLSATQFSLSMEKKPLQSSGMAAYAKSVNNVTRTNGPFIQDTPEISLSTDFNLDRPLLKKICEMLAKQRNRLLKCKVRDASDGISWEMDECYAMGFSFSVIKDSVLNAKMDFAVRDDSMKMDWSDKTMTRTGLGTTVPVKNLIPYWAWQLKYGGKVLDGVTEFSFSFSQNIEKKYGCTGSKTSYSTSADMFVFGLPQFNFDVTRVIYNASSMTFGGSGNTVHKKIDDSDMIEVLLDGQRVFALTGAARVNYEPLLLEDIQICRTKYMIDGAMKI